MGLFDKIKNAFSGKKEKEEIINYDKGLEKSRREFVSQLSNLSKKYKNITDDYFEELENILIMADIGVNTVVKFVDRLKDRVKKEKITDSDFLKEIIVDELFVMYVGNNIIDSKIHFNLEGPTVILFVGSPLTILLNTPVLFLPNVRESLSDDQLKMASRNSLLALMPSSPYIVSSS